jgi:probable F420-dependent oxidoreductase
MPDATLAFSLPLTGVEPGAGIELARRSETFGYEACWLSEVQGPDAFTQAGALAVTTGLELGVAVVPVQTRTTMILGMTAVTLAQMTGGRFTLGIGASSELIVSGWAGQPFDRPLTHVRETAEALRPVLRGERTNYEGRYVTVDGYRPHATPTEPVPLWIGALNERSLGQAGAIADGVCLNQLGPEHVDQLLGHVRSGAAEAGRDLRIGSDSGDFGVMARIFCAITDDVSMAREIVKHAFGPYIATSVYNRYYRSLGYVEEAEGVAAAAADGDRQAIAAAVSDRLVDEVFVLGSAEEVGSRLRAYADAGVTVVAVHPLAPSVEAAEAMLQAIAEQWGY